jgi:hypothetical protein
MRQSAGKRIGSLVSPLLLAGLVLLAAAPGAAQAFYETRITTDMAVQ